MEESEVVLYVGVRWFWSSQPVGTLDIAVDIDGRRVTDGREFPSPEARKGPDAFGLRLSKGVHHLRASSVKANAAFETDFGVSRDAHWADLCYDHYPKDHPYYQKYRPFDPNGTSGHREGFTFEIQDRDFGWR